VSGAFYWATSKVASSSNTTNTFYLAVCDSTGHGVPGAFMSLLNISFLNEAINEKGIEAPNEVFNHVRQRLIENIGQEGAQDGMDATLIKIAGNKIEYAAAYNAPVVIRKGEIVECGYDKMPIGTGETSEGFTNYKLELEKGDMLYLYTDGFADQFGGEKGKKYKDANLKRLFRAIAKENTQKQNELLAAEMETWILDNEQVDDICIIGIQV
jgi:serine phosphatase RsbU (regulator of sigma subunit)